MGKPLTHDIYIQRLKDKNLDIDVCEDFKGTHTKILHKCRKCNNLIPMTHEEFVAKIALINPNIEIIGKFKGVTKKIKCRCKICEHVWSTDAQVLYKHGCPVCAGVIKTPEIFYREVEEKFPNQYEFLTEYK